MQIDGAYTRELTDVDAELARIIRRWEPTADRAWAVRSSIGHVLINQERLEAALDCLLENAVKFTGDGDRIEVLGTGRPDSWSIAVTDTGVGLTSEQVTALATSGATPGRTTSGTGLGLAIARAVAASWGGSLLLYGEPGAGTAATLHFPRRMAPVAVGDDRAMTTT
jgi:signal transduction histidine kinase